MSTYAIGDIQGCYLTLQKLLTQIRFNPAQDRLWLTGDLVNRGPRSLEVLRWAQSLGERLIAVLGNHDLHLLARAEGWAPPKKKDTLEEVLNAPDSKDLIHWLRHRPLLHREAGFLMIHGALDPSWSATEAETLAREAEAFLRGPRAGELLSQLTAPVPPSWDPALRNFSRIQLVVKILTRLRICKADGTLNFDFSDVPEAAPPGYLPWFEVSDRRHADHTVTFGHWAALGLRLQPGVIALDTGCVWGRYLTAYCLESAEVFQEPFGG